MALVPLKNWRCPFCGHHTTLSHAHWSEAYAHAPDSKLGSQAVKIIFMACANKNCRELTVAASLGEYVNRPNGPNSYRTPHTTWMLRPEANVRQFPDYVPPAILGDYREACLILSDSPKASATLSRRCLQGMIRDFWKVSRKTLYDEINAIEEKVDVDTWEAIDAVRKIGNIGAHMQKDIDVIVDVEPQEAGLLIQLIEDLISDWYVQRYERQKRRAAIVAAAEGKGSLQSAPPKSAEPSVDGSEAPPDPAV